MPSELRSVQKIQLFFFVERAEETEEFGETTAAADESGRALSEIPAEKTRPETMETASGTRQAQHAGKAGSKHVVHMSKYSAWFVLCFIYLRRFLITCFFSPFVGSHQLAEGHHGSSLLRRCLLSWQQIANDSLAERTASAAELYHHILLRRCLSNWLKVN